MNRSPLVLSQAAPGVSARRAALRGWGVLALIHILAWAWPGPDLAAQPTPPASAKTTVPGSGVTPTESASAQVWGAVRAVPNGTSLVVITPELGRVDVRLLGIEPPEVARPAQAGGLPTVGQPFGQEATNYLRDLLWEKQVRLDPYGKDRSGRTLAVVWLGDINVNLTLVKEGFAWVSPSVPISKVRVELEVAERQAQVAKYGLWALPNPEPPWDFRKRHQLPAE